MTLLQDDIDAIRRLQSIGLIPTEYDPVRHELKVMTKIDSRISALQCVGQCVGQQSLFNEVLGFDLF